MAIITETGVSNSDGYDGTGVMELLGAGIPISLLMDLVDAGGPQSRDLVDNEVGDASWLGWSRSHAAGAA
ncbi:MAG: hypothetical protein QOE76_4085 [Frankiales bacterium]|jgi:hypothetical protein|nr:hypothetical protein [Frankiales bacterium]MDX6246362.1 hypothetical protein [Frankiales bacterium]